MRCIRMIGLCLLAACAMSAVAAPSASAGKGAALAASGPVMVAGSKLLTGVACPSVSQCTAVTEGGAQEVTFNPQSPGSPPLTTIQTPNFASSLGQVLAQVACPSASQCTVIDGSPNQVTFNPKSPGIPTPVTITGFPHSVPCPPGLSEKGVTGCTETSGGLGGVACPTVAQCTAMDDVGEVTFNPTSRVVPTRFELFANPVDGAACPSVSQCTVFDGNGVSTFNPTSPGTPNHVALPLGGGLPLNAIACPSTSQCTALNQEGYEVTFNPTSPGNPATTRVYGAGGFACPTVSQCTALNVFGHPLKAQAVTFNPTSPGTRAQVTIDGFKDPIAVACPSASQCTMVGRGAEVTFNPKAPGLLSPKCLVPELKGRTLAKAKTLLARAHCKLGTVTKPAKHKHTLVVVSEKPGAKKSLPNGNKVSVRLG